MIMCPKCHTENINNSNYCIACGENLSQYGEPKQAGHSKLLIITVILGVVITLFIIIAALFLTGVLKLPSAETATEKTVQEQVVPPKQETALFPVAVEKTMYVGNCNVSVSLREGPGTDYKEICQAPLGGVLYVYEYTNDSFARVSFNGKDGYIARKFIVPTQAKVYDYDEYQVEQLVENSVYCLMDAINYGYKDYVPHYYSGDEAKQERATIDALSSKNYREEVISINCHSVQRVSASQVSVIRDSIIRVYPYEGDVFDATESYKYIVDISNNDYKIVDILKN